MKKCDLYVSFECAMFMFLAHPGLFDHRRLVKNVHCVVGCCHFIIVCNHSNHCVHITCFIVCLVYVVGNIVVLFLDGIWYCLDCI